MATKMKEARQRALRAGPSAKPRNAVARGTSRRGPMQARRRKRTTGPEQTWQTMPGELLEAIFGFLHPVDVLRCASVCKHWQEATNQQRLWRVLFTRRFPRLKPKPDQPEWRHECLSRVMESCRRFMRRCGALTPDPYTSTPQIGRFLRDVRAVYVLRIVAEHKTHNLVVKHSPAMEHRLGILAQWTKKLDTIDWPHVTSVSLLVSTLADPAITSCKTRTRSIITVDQQYTHSTTLAPPSSSSLSAQSSSSPSLVVADDSVVTVATRSSGMILGLWKGDARGAPAFVAWNVTYAALLNAIRFATENRVHRPRAVAAMEDDVSTRYGLINYHVVVQVRTLTDVVFLHASHPVDCAEGFTTAPSSPTAPTTTTAGSTGASTKTKHGSLYAVLPLIGAGTRQSHLPCDSADTTLMWKCAAFSGEIKDALLVDAVVRDEHGGVVTQVSKMVRAGHTNADQRRDDYAFSEGDGLAFRAEEDGQLLVDGEIVKEDPYAVMRHLRVLLSVHTINKHFGRSYP